jgi:hypothetical protein
VYFYLLLLLCLLKVVWYHSRLESERIGVYVINFVYFRNVLPLSYCAFCWGKKCNIMYLVVIYVKPTLLVCNVCSSGVLMFVTEI